MSGSGISWNICKSAPRSRQIIMPAPHRCFYRLDALPAAQPTASKHWRQIGAKRHWCKSSARPDNPQSKVPFSMAGEILDPHKSTPQTASRSVQMFKDSLCWWPTYGKTDKPCYNGNRLHLMLYIAMQPNSIIYILVFVHTTTDII